ncbi:MAG: CAP domain-containing protein [Acidimicrobiales bacterium]
MTSRKHVEVEARSTGRGRSWRSAATVLAGALGLSLAVSLASAGAAAAACPPGTVLYRNVCITFGFPSPTPTTTPVTTPPTTAAPIDQLPPVTAPPIVLPPVLGPTTTQVVPSAAQRLLDLANAEREKVGLLRLTSRDDIVAIAVAHSQEMARKGDIFHSTSFFASAVKSLLNAAVRGENVAYNGDVDNTHTRLMASAGHRANILDPRFAAVGIGVVQAPDGRYFVTQNFIQPAGAPPAGRAAAAPRVAAPAASRKAPAPKPAAPAPTTTMPAPPTTVAAPVPAPTTVDVRPVVAIDPVSSAVSATSTAGHPVNTPLTATAVVLLVGAVAACYTVPRRYSWA